jgi:endonuclease YncB( thermonuclease family)
VGVKTKPKRLTAGALRKIGVKEVLIPGLLLAGVLGWQSWKTLGPDFYKNQRVFPMSGMVKTVTDGDTFELRNGVRVRMIGINAPDRGEAKSDEATKQLRDLVENKRVYLEYDRYQDDKNGRDLAWVWIVCESLPKFLPSGYMHLTYNRSKEGLKENPAGCKKGKLVQEEMVKAGLAVVEVYKDRGELKYEERIRSR